MHFLCLSFFSLFLFIYKMIPTSSHWLFNAHAHFKMVCLFFIFKLCFALLVVECINLATLYACCFLLPQMQKYWTNSYKSEYKIQKERWNNVNVKHNKIVYISPFFPLLSAHCENCMCIAVFQFYVPYQRQKAK